VLAAADAVVICSDSEGLPMLALEAMASGLPLIATRVGGLSALLGGVDDPHACGLAIPIGQPDVLAEAIVRLDRDRGLGRVLGSRGRQRVAADYSSAAMGARVLDVYDEVLQPDPASRVRPPR
jgi:glycosyltransferase involved in cell wall biosynthesis